MLLLQQQQQQQQLSSALRVKVTLTRALLSFVGPVCWFESIYSTSIYNQRRHL
jgi:hypothetical protein